MFFLFHFMSYITENTYTYTLNIVKLMHTRYCYFTISGSCRLYVVGPPHPH